MTLVLNLSPGVEERINGEAQRRGISKEEVVREVIEHRVTPTPGSMTPKQLMEHWRAEGIIGPWGDESLDAPELARELRRKAETRRSEG